MKLLKFSILICALFVGMSSLHAQVEEGFEIKKSLLMEYESGTPDEIAELQTNRMTNELELSEVQSTNVYFLNQKVAEKIAAIKGNSDLSSEKKKEFIEGNLMDRRRAMSSILTPTQFEKFNELDY